MKRILILICGLLVMTTVRAEESKYSWGEPKEGIRLGLAPNPVALPANLLLKVEACFENVGDKPVQVPTGTSGKMMMLTVGDQTDYLFDIAGLKSKRAAQMRELAPGERYTEEFVVSLQTKWKDGNIFVGRKIALPADDTPMTLQLGWLPGHPSPSTAEHWRDSKMLTSGQITVHWQTPDAIGLVQSLLDPEPVARANAATALRTILAKDPAAAPNWHAREFWEARLARITTNMTEDAALEILLPDTTPAERKNAPAWGTGGSGGQSMTYRVDDYWAVTLNSMRYTMRISKPPQLQSLVRRVWVEPPQHFTGMWSTYYVNGQTSNEIEYRDGKYHGTFTEFRDDGSKWSRRQYDSGVLYGAETEWHPNGRIFRQGRYEHGKRVGTWTQWDEAGKVTSEKEFE